MKQSLAIGIDLHGTLLDGSWRIPHALVEPLKDLLTDVSRACSLYVCSGNDLTFVRKYLPSRVVECFSGFVLETGCVVSRGKDETLIVPPQVLETVKACEAQLKAAEFKEVRFFARRLATVSLFTRDEKGGTGPAELYPAVCARIRELGLDRDLRVTHSNVAVDVIPAWHSKMTGMRHVAEEMPIVGIADSMNDRELIQEADYAFIPANASDKLKQLVQSDGKAVKALGRASALEPGAVLQSQTAYGEGVKEILEFIRDKCCEA